MARGLPRRVAMISVHTSPLDQPGSGDAGGLNVYVVELSRRLAEQGVAVEIFTRATSRRLPPVVELDPGILVRHVVAGPLEGLTKRDLPGQLCTFARDVLRTEASFPPGYYDLVHSHYWLSGQVGALARDRWGVPMVHTMHTLAKVKNRALADGDAAEPLLRIVGEEQVVEAADLVIANTAQEASQLVGLYGAEPARVRVVNPGVDLTVFRPGDRMVSRARLGLAPDARVLMFAGRLQRLKAPDVVVRAAALLLACRPDLRESLVVPVIGGPSGSGRETLRALARLAHRLGVRDVVRLVPPVDQAHLVDWYRAASVVCVPSYSESFGLVALEAQACGTPVVASRAGGLSTAVLDGESGVLVDGHDPADYARVFEWLLADSGAAERFGRRAVEHAAGFGWRRTAERTLDAYRHATAIRRSVPTFQVPAAR
ncbi:MAG TPA: D-inositol-3-phosphate glycosyltransferase [Nocardioidaceae bacterium]|nr:D-inositol-3-phosphate glycosyltransferase [Nocardioidaceae bacterium]